MGEGARRVAAGARRALALSSSKSPRHGQLQTPQTLWYCRRKKQCARQRCTVSMGAEHVLGL